MKYDTDMSLLFFIYILLFATQFHWSHVVWFG
jgi:hypothetical protein